MQTTTHHFFSDNLQLEGYYYEADRGSDAAKPIILTCSGFTGLARIHPERYARAFTKKGYPCFGFDYRGFGNSQGAVGQVLLDEQIRDIANAVEFVSQKAGAENRKIVLAGWGMGAGLILKSALLTDKIAGLVLMNGFYNNVRVQKALRSASGYQKFQGWLNQQRAQVIQGQAKADLDPFDIYPLDPVSKDYVDSVLRKTPGYGLTCSVSFADSLLSFDAEAGVESLAHIPTLVAHGADNALHPVLEAQSIFDRLSGDKELFLLEGAGHTEWMLDDNPLFIKFSNTIEEWIAARF